MTQATHHLALDELRRWRDEPAPADRDRIVSHLAVCDACGARYAELVRTAPPASLESGFDPELFRKRGYRVSPGGAPRWWRAAPGIRTLAPLAAAAMLVIAGIAYFAAPPPPAERVVRGGQSGVQLVRPVGDSVPVTELRFEWSAPEGTAGYALHVVDLASLDEPVISRDGVTSGYAPTADERQRLQTGITYRWYVEYRTAGGGTAVSPAATFSIR